MTTIAHPLDVLYDHCPVGTVRISRRLPRKLFGRFDPGLEFDRCRAAFEEAMQLARRFDESHFQASLDYLAFEQYGAAIHRITERVQLPQLSQVIEEFAIDHQSQVEITLAGEFL